VHGSSQPSEHFHPAKAFLDLFADALTGLVFRRSGGAPIQPFDQTFLNLSDMRTESHVLALLNKDFSMVALIPGRGPWSVSTVLGTRLQLARRHRRLADLDGIVDVKFSEQAVAVLHQGMKAIG
jgi:hypothetical protein